ncbi:MAG: DNA-directed RNA polymerase subunit beta' [Calditrichaeota bacterium]|nr:MAG: DNA-directed RNA polymerase subunit beta' [Calditrichota bacterium]
MPKDYRMIAVGLAAPDKIRSWGFGEVTKPETINYRSFKPERDGLFCEKIFGPVKDYECACGKYKRIRYKGIICDRCGVEVTSKSVRRERMGFIELAVPVVHIWYFRSLPTKIGYMLGISVKNLEKVIYYERYIVINPGKSGREVCELLNEEEYYELTESFGGQEIPAEERFKAGIGGVAIKELLANLDIPKLQKYLRHKADTETSQQRKIEALKRLKILRLFDNVNEDSPLGKPEWMVLDVIPIIPPELRPLVPLEGGRFATSDLNDLYRRVIIRNNRLKKLLDIKAPEVILKNEKRMLQEAIDSLFDNGKRQVAEGSDGKRALKSLSDSLKGKQGRFRQNLLGKRVDYSGRSVIVVGPTLKLHECGLPKDMAVELFKPFIIRKLVERGIVKTVKTAKKVVGRKGPEIWGILEEIVREHPVLLNRAPTLHRLGIQAFQPRIIEGKAINLHPLVCTAFNADFDGDQMAVHVPLSFEAQLEAKHLMLASKNILHPASGMPIAVPSQDIVLGLYYVSKMRSNVKRFSVEGIDLHYSRHEILVGHQTNNLPIGMQIKIKLKAGTNVIDIDEESISTLKEDKMISTSVGRVVLNEIVPSEIGYINDILTKKKLEKLVNIAFRTIGEVRTAEFLDNLKNLGYTYSTRGGLSFGVDDIMTPEEKVELINSANTEVERIQDQFSEGLMTDGERYNKVIDIWTRTTNKVSDKLMDRLKNSRDGFNSVYMMSHSGARGNRDQIKQLAGMRGLMAKPQKNKMGVGGEIIENPITANFREGLTVLEYFISTHGARKGLADTALKTADAGYLTRRLVDVAQDVVITEHDCGVHGGIEVAELKEGGRIVERLKDRILGRVLADDVFDERTGEVVAEYGDLIDEELANTIDAIPNLESVEIRSVLTCKTERGVCALCYGRNLTTGNLVSMGEAVGVMAAQSIGEPGTQLTLRNFHIGGAANLIAAQDRIDAKSDGVIHYSDKLITVEKENEEGVVEIIALSRNGKLVLKDKDGQVIADYSVNYGAVLFVKDQQEVKKNSPLFKFDPFNSLIIAEKNGNIKYFDFKDGITFREEADEVTGGRRQLVITESKDKSLTPKLNILDPETEEKIASYILPIRTQLNNIKEGDFVEAGTILAKIPRDAALINKDITGGLPRVAELFEARKPKDPAVVTEISGSIKLGKIKRGVREIHVTSEDKKTSLKYNVPYGKHVLVHEGDYVKAGDPLCQGSIAPQDILAIAGIKAVEEYLVNEIQEVYRLQGVKISDKHIEIIVRQMLQKEKVEDPGDTKYIEGDQVNRIAAEFENQRIINSVVIEEIGDSRYQVEEIVNKIAFEKEIGRLQKRGLTLPKGRGANPAILKPILLGITPSSLGTESFISAASFQETTKVLTEAAIEGRVDYLRGLKENVIMGRLIPAGTGLGKYTDLRVSSESENSKDSQEENVTESESESAELK